MAPRRKKHSRATSSRGASSMESFWLAQREHLDIHNLLTDPDIQRIGILSAITIILLISGIIILFVALKSNSDVLTSFLQIFSTIVTVLSTLVVGFKWRQGRRRNDDE